MQPEERQRKRLRGKLSKSYEHVVVVVAEAALMAETEIVVIALTEVMEEEAAVMKKRHQSLCHLQVHLHLQDQVSQLGLCPNT